jgi:hypothetical protein
MTFVEFRAAVRSACGSAPLVTSLVEVTDLGDGRTEIAWRAYSPASGWVRSATADGCIAQLVDSRPRTEEEVSAIGSIPAVAHV